MSYPRKPKMGKEPTTSASCQLGLGFPWLSGIGRQLFLGRSHLRKIFVLTLFQDTSTGKALGDQAGPCGRRQIGLPSNITRLCPTLEKGFGRFLSQPHIRNWCFLGCDANPSGPASALSQRDLGVGGGGKRRRP
jgi:hypothetical protein